MRQSLRAAASSWLKPTTWNSGILGVRRRAGKRVPRRCVIACRSRTPTVNAVRFNFPQIGTTSVGCSWFLNSAGGMPVKLFSALTRVLQRPQPPTPPPPTQFDDGLTEIARLIAREVPAGDAEVRPKTSSKDKASTT